MNDGKPMQLSMHPDLHRTLPGYSKTRFALLNECIYRIEMFFFPPGFSRDNLIPAEPLDPLKRI